MRIVLLYVSAALFLLLLVGMSTGYGGFVLSLLLAVFAVLLITLGPERLGIGLVGTAFFLAPGGIGDVFQFAGPSVLITDLALLGGVVLLLPRLVQSRYKIAAPLVAAVALIASSGFLASAAMAPDPGASIKTLVGWLWCLAIIPLLMIGLNPSRRLLHGLAWAFVGGHLIDVVYSVAQDPTTGIRHQGLTQHPNAFGESGLMAFALLLYLMTRSQHRLLVFVAMAGSLLSVYLSGSRGATVAVAMLVLVVPLVERTAVAGVLTAFVVAAGTIALSFLIQTASEDSSLGRLAGNDGTAAHSNVEREEGIAAGFDRFLAHPLTGSGYYDLGTIHIVLLEVAVAAGVIGAFGFLLYLWAVGRPLLGLSQERRLAYTVLAYAAFSSTAPALTDRTAWLPIALSLAVFRGFRNEPDGTARPEEEPAKDPARSSRSMRGMRGASR